MGGKRKKSKGKKSSKKKKTIEEEEEEDIQEEDNSPAIDWSFSDDDDDDEDDEEPEEEITYAKKIAIPQGAQKKLVDLMEMIKRLQKQIVTKEKDIYEMKHSLTILSSDYQEMADEFEWHKSENTKKDAIIDKYSSKINRLNEDFEKLYQRTKEEKEENIKKAGKRLLKKFVDVQDNLEMAIEANEGEEGLENFVRGLQLISKQISGIFEGEGVWATNPMNEEFNPERHEAVEVITDKSVQENTVIEVVKKGYILENETLRVSIVKVSKGGPARPEKKKKEEEPENEEEETEEEPTEDNEEEFEEMEEEEEEQKPKKGKKGSKKGSSEKKGSKNKKSGADKKKGKKKKGTKKDDDKDDSFDEIDDMWEEVNEKPKKKGKKKKSKK